MVREFSVFRPENEDHRRFPVRLDPRPPSKIIELDDEEIHRRRRLDRLIGSPPPRAAPPLPLPPVPPPRSNPNVTLPVSLRCSSCTHPIPKASHLHYFNVRFSPEAPQPPTKSDEDKEAAAKANYLLSHFNPYYYKRKSFDLKCSDCQANITVEQDLQTSKYSIVSGATVDPDSAENEELNGYGKKFEKGGDEESLKDMMTELIHLERSRGCAD